MSRSASLVALSVLAVACGEQVTPSVVSPDLAQQAAAPVLAAAPGQGIAGRYIVVLKGGMPGERAGDVAAAMGVGRGAMRHEYNSALSGFAADLSDADVARLARHPRVAYLEQDQVMTTTATQSSATWGLDRIDQVSLPLSTTFTYTRTGAGVHAYIIDTGILATHTQFTGRVGAGRDFVDNDADPTDCNGHGTHVAGTVGGTIHGVAKGVILHGVRVLSCTGSGSTSGVIAGVDWVRLNAIKPAVANMSLGGGVSTTLDNAVTSAINAGVTFAVAAGNSNVNACNSSPARAAAAITVGATTSTDARASYSNFGSCLDLFAPGSSITSAWYTGTSATNTISGTSMATPHVAGVAALYLQGNPTASAATVRNALVNAASSNKVTNPGSNSPNKLLFTNY